MKNLKRSLFLDSAILSFISYIVVTYSIDSFMTPWGPINSYNISLSLFNLLGALAASYCILAIMALGITHERYYAYLIYAGLGTFSLSLAMCFITYGEIVKAFMNIIGIGSALIFTFHITYGTVILLVIWYRTRQAEQAAPRNR